MLLFQLGDSHAIASFFSVTSEMESGGQEKEAQAQARARRPTGLMNLGNTCYLNSVLQCLTYTPPLAEHCLGANPHSASCNISSNHDCPFCLLEKRIVRSLCNTAQSCDSPREITNSLNLFAKHFVKGNQEDAHEFVTYVIGACNDVCTGQWKQQRVREKDGGDEGIIKSIFGGVTQSQVKCIFCGGESNKKEDIMDLSLPLTNAVTSLEEALSCYFASQLLEDGDNVYRCQNCKNLTPAQMQMSIFKPPNVLVIQLNRFAMDDYGSSIKINRNISFKQRLGLDNYLSAGADQEKYNINTDYYILFATIIHSRFSQDSGHYYAYVKNLEDDSWHCCNDANVSPVSEQEVLSDQQVYLLFFIRKELTGLKSYSDCNGAAAVPTTVHDDVIASAGDTEMQDDFADCNHELELEKDDDITADHGDCIEDVFADSNDNCFAAHQNCRRIDISSKDKFEFEFYLKDEHIFAGGDVVEVNFKPHDSVGDWEILEVELNEYVEDEFEDWEILEVESNDYVEDECQDWEILEVELNEERKGIYPSD